jgi:glycosyltransferase involved in cell wall biosynthesis
MGRQAAGDGFLRAMVKGRDPGPLFAYTASRKSAEAFAARVAELDPEAAAVWVPANRLAALGERGVLYRPDHHIAIDLYARLRVGGDRYSICGVTHTLSTSGATEIIANLVNAPAMPWDAVVCTSRVAVGLVEDGMAAQRDYLRWRLGVAVEPPRPQLPLIPLGVHTGDFDFTAEDRARARESLGIADDEVAGLFAGRLTFSGKAHPYPMYRAMQEVAEATGRKLVLIHAGQFASAAVRDVFHAAVRAFCPNVRCLFLNGGDPDNYRRGWQAADVFISLSDNIQETFGITPVEAMAAGLPVLVSDWNGYKDTVRDGVDGFRVPTWQPGPGFGENITRDFETNTTDYDFFLSRTSTTVVVEMRALVQRLTELVTDAELRRRMGASGQARARELYDWAVIYRQYQALWAELDAIRAQARTSGLLEGAPASGPHRRDTFTVFSAFPTHWVKADTAVRPTPEARVERYRALIKERLLSVWPMPDEVAVRVFTALAEGPSDVGSLARAARVDLREMVHIAGRLAKMGLIELG